MELNDIRLRSVLYQLDKLTLQAGGTTFEVPRAMVTSISIDNNYETSMFPFFYVGMNLPGWVYIEVAKNPKNLFITLDLKANLFVDTIEDKPVGTYKEYKGKYMAMAAIDTPVADESIQMKIAKQNDTYKKTYEFNEFYFAEFLLYNPQYYAALTKPVNAVITSANMTSIATYVLQCGGINNLLMSPFDNRASYSEFKVIPENAIDELKHLMQAYGFHNAGSVFFMDLDKAFLINKAVKCTAWYQGEYKTVHVMSMSNFNNSLGAFSGYFSSAKDHYHLLGIEPNQIQVSDIGNVKSKTMTNYYHGEGKMLSFKTDSALMECFTPNKEFLVNIDSTGASNGKVNGRYRIMRVTLTLSPSGEYMTPEFHVFLMK